jgi:hypothetical protein
MADVPLHLVAARLRPAAAAVDDDEDWDAVIARAKMQAALPRAPRAGGFEKTQATLDALVRGGLKKPVPPLPAFVARRPVEEDLATPPPLGTARRAAGTLSGRAKRA